MFIILYLNANLKFMSLLKLTEINNRKKVIRYIEVSYNRNSVGIFNCIHHETGNERIT